LSRERVLVIGHRSPDSDAVCAAIGYAYFKNMVDRSRLYVACAAGPLNPETSYIVERFGLEPPVQVESVAATVADMTLSRPITLSPGHSILDAIRLIREKHLYSLPVVDAENRLVGVIDVELPPEIAGVLLSGILSDTLLLTLSTATEKDVTVAHRLGEMTGLDLAELGKELLAVSITTKGVSAREIVTRDFKEYQLLGKKIGVNQIMVLDEEELTAREGEIKYEMEQLFREGGYHLLVLLITNPLTRKGEEIWVQGEEEIVEKAFGVKVVDGKCHVPEVMSRKKDFIPRLAVALRR